MQQPSKSPSKKEKKDKKEKEKDKEKEKEIKVGGTPSPFRPTPPPSVLPSISFSLVFCHKIDLNDFDDIVDCGRSRGRPDALTFSSSPLVVAFLDLSFGRPCDDPNLIYIIFIKL